MSTLETCKSEGKYFGRPISVVPYRHLRKVVQTKAVGWQQAEAELDRRGMPVEPRAVTVTAHAIDRASQKFLRDWKADRLEGEGIYSWLARIAEERLIERAASGHVGEVISVKHGRMDFRIRRDGSEYFLVTVV